MLGNVISRWIMVWILCVPMMSFAADLESGKPNARIPEPAFEFQPVVEGTKVVHDFVIQNRGEAPLDILKMESG